MKTKLLKEIRKRYAIKKIESIASNAGSNKINAANKFGLPFFVLIDDYEELSKVYEYFKTFDEAYTRLREWIIIDYSEQFRHKDEKSTKMWWK